VMLRWGDLLSQHLNPHGLPPPRIGLKELQARVPTGVLKFHDALQLLDDLLDCQRTQARLEAVPLGLQQFLAQYLAQHPASARIFVHSPEKEYCSPEKWYGAQDANNPRLPPPLTPPTRGDQKHSPPAQYLKTSSLIDMVVSGEQGAHEASASPASAILSKLAAASPNQSRRPSVASVGEQQGPSQSMDLQQFLAMLHGDELQRWVRSVRFRWGKVKQVRGLMALMAEAPAGQKQDLLAVVLPGGLTLARVLLAWRHAVPPRTTPGAKLPEMDSVRSVHEASLAEAGRRTRRLVTPSAGEMASAGMANAITEAGDFGGMESVSTSGGESFVRGELLDPAASKGAAVGQHLLAGGQAEAEVLPRLRAVEEWYETRVAAGERLVGFYVLLHAMVQPSSRLPFLSYEMGKSESRLRVASTPAPVPMVGSAGEEGSSSAGAESASGQKIVHV